MDNQLPTSGVAAGSRKFGAVVIVLVVLAVLALGVFYMLRPGAVKDEESLAGEEAALEEKAVVEEAASAGAEALTVSIKDFKFVPGTVTIKAGESVTWKNNEAGVPHSIVLDNGDYKSAAIFPGERETRRFPVAGTYPYHCGIHPSMKGTVVVR